MWASQISFGVIYQTLGRLLKNCSVLRIHQLLLIDKIVWTIRPTGALFGNLKEVWVKTRCYWSRTPHPAHQDHMVQTHFSTNILIYTTNFIYLTKHRRTSYTLSKWYKQDENTPLSVLRIHNKTDSSYKNIGCVPHCRTQKHQKFQIQLAGNISRSA